MVLISIGAWGVSSSNLLIRSNALPDAVHTILSQAWPNASVWRWMNPAVAGAFFTVGSFSALPQRFLRDVLIIKCFFLFALLTSISLCDMDLKFVINAWTKTKIICVLSWVDTALQAFEASACSQLQQVFSAVTATTYKTMEAVKRTPLITHKTGFSDVQNLVKLAAVASRISRNQSCRFYWATWSLHNF